MIRSYTTDVSFQYVDCVDSTEELKTSKFKVLISQINPLKETFYYENCLSCIFFSI